MNKIINLAETRILERGLDYYKRDKVLFADRLGNNCYAGKVLGSVEDPYDVLVNIKFPDASRCTCPYNADKQKICKHMIALLLAADSSLEKSVRERVEKENKKQITARLYICRNDSK